jgi:HSP20 family molecular chaperone IbpA
MVLVPWRFYEDLSCFNREMNQLFDRFFGAEFVEGLWEKISYPPMRVAETKNEIIVFLQIFPLSPDEIEVTYKDDLLVIQGEKKNTDDFHYPQKGMISFKRIIHIPKKIHADKIEAKFQGGELSIILPKMENTTFSMKIKIE